MGCGNNSTSGREYAVDRLEVLACVLRIRAHAAFSDDHADAGLLHEFLLELFHSHARCRSNGDHLKFVIWKRADDRACVEDRRIFYIHRKFPVLFHKTAVSHVTAGRHASV